MNAGRAGDQLDNTGMRVFISHSHLDREAVDLIADRLRRDGHDVWVDTDRLVPGDNILEKVEKGLAAADVLIVVVSQNSSRSQWVQHEYSAIAFQQISEREPRIIPIRLDNSEVPAYLASRLYVDLSDDFNSGLEALSKALKRIASPERDEPAERGLLKADARSAQVARLREALRRGRLTLMCGAGVSVQAGIPGWRDLLIRLLERMMERVAKTHALELDVSAAIEFERRYGSSSLILGK